MVAITRSLVERENMIDTPRSISIFVVGLIFTVTSLISFALRLMSKRITKSKLAVEDYLCLTSLICVLGLFITIVLHIQLGGMGHHVADLPPTDVSYTLQVLVAFQSLYTIGVGAVKSSIVFFYIRIFFSIDRRMRLVSYGVIAFIWSWVILSVLVAFLSCTPFAFTWNPFIPGGHCDNVVGSFVAEATLDLVADAMVLALPLRPIWKLHVSNGKKLALFVVFGLGLTTMIMAILRIIGLAELDYSDFEWTACAPIAYSLLEPAIGITVACMPLMQPVFQNTWIGRQLLGRDRPTKKPTYGKSSNFERLGDEYPLNSRGNNVNVTGGPGAGGGSFAGSEDGTGDMYEHAGKGGKSNFITVKHEVTTYSS